MFIPSSFYFYSALFISVPMVLVFINFLYFEKGRFIAPVLTKLAFLEVKHLWSF